MSEAQTETTAILPTEVTALNTARTILTNIASTLPPWDEGDQVGYRYGRVVEASQHAADAIFNVLNSINAYDLANLTDKQIHNRETNQ